MVAKKGDVQAHHFAHHAQQDGRSCVSAGEMALHKFARKILDERLEITLPRRSLRNREIAKLLSGWRSELSIERS